MLVHFLLVVFGNTLHAHQVFSQISVGTLDGFNILLLEHHQARIRVWLLC